MGRVFCYVSVILAAKVVEGNVQCDMYMSYVDGFGVGVYAGRAYSPDEILENAIGIPIRSFSTGYNELENYCEGHNGTHDKVTLGYSLILNHAPASEGSMVKKISPEGNSSISRLQTESVDITYVSNWVIFPGDQIFTDYGPQWFQTRGLVERGPRQESNKDVRHIDNIASKSTTVPGCPNYYTRWDGSKLVAARMIPKGEIIEVARGLLLPEYRFHGAGLLEEFLWWRKRKNRPPNPPLSDPERIHISDITQGVYEGDKKYALLLLGNGALYGSKSEINDVNVDYDWWDFSLQGVVTQEHKDDDGIGWIHHQAAPNANESAAKMSREMSAEGEAVHGPSRRRTNHGNLCSLRTMVSFTAVRDIHEGEPLIVDLDLRKRNGHRHVNREFARQCM